MRSTHNDCTRNVIGLLATMLVVLSTASSQAAAPQSGAGTNQGQNWSRFRGPDGSGISHDTRIPVKWTESNILWKTAVAGVGHCSPCVWEDRVFITTGIDEGVRRAVVCIDVNSGETVWTKAFESATLKKHDKNSYATSTPATDGQRVYVSYNTVDEYTLMALDFQGNVVWQRNLGPYTSQHACGVSPIVIGDTVYLANDQDGPSFIIAVDSKTGKDRWKVERKFKDQATSYATPLLLERPGQRAEIVFSSGLEGVVAYDAQSGQRRWGSEPLPARAVASPIYANDLIFQICGGGGNGTYMAAYRPKGADGVEVVWTRDRELPYVPTPIAYQDLLFLWDDTLGVYCLKAATGEQLWHDRLKGAAFFGSPVCVDGKLYCVSEQGDVFVLRAADQYELLAKNPLDDPSHSTPAVSRGRMFIRTFHQLFCIGEPGAAKVRPASGS